jgi:membrane-associated phospholipid phosphatase
MMRAPLLAAMVCFGLAPLALMVDLPVAQYCQVHRAPGELRRLLGWSEVWAHGLGVAIVAISLYTLDPSNRRRIPRLLVAAYGAGLAADVIKLCVARIRPRFFDLSGSVWDTFAGWFPVLNWGDAASQSSSRFQSFPSAHTAVAVALLFGLARIYPQGRALFAFFALLAAFQRVEAGAHYLSDTLAGAAVGAIVFVWCDRSLVLGRWLARIERSK